jgi:hypothetical protein
MKIIYKSFLIGFFCAILTIVQGYFSMGKYANEISSGCLECSFNEILIKSAVILIFLPIFLAQLIFDKFFKKKYIITVLIAFFLIFVWLKIINSDVFETRVSSWSTFSNADIEYFVFIQSYKPILICIFLYLLFTLILNKYFGTISKQKDGMNGKV